MSKEKMVVVRKTVPLDAASHAALLTIQRLTGRKSTEVIRFALRETKRALLSLGDQRVADVAAKAATK